MKTSALAVLVRPEKWITLLLLFMFLTAAAAGVTSVLIGPDWGSLWRGLTFGLLIGWGLAVIRQPAWRAGLTTITMGVLYTLLYTAGLAKRLSAIVTELGNIARLYLASPVDPIIDWVPLAQWIQLFFRSVGVVVERVDIWLSALIAGESAFDPVAAAIVWSFMIWLIASWAGWIVEARHNALAASLPALLLSLGVLSYGRRESIALYIMLASVLLLLATVQLDRRRQRWDKTGVAYPPRKGRQIGNTASIVVVVLVLLSAGISSISFPRIFEWISDRADSAQPQAGGLAKSLGIMAGPTPIPDRFEDVRSPGLPRELLIGSGPELSRRLVMTVEIEDYPSIFGVQQPFPLYWRSFTYDVYTGHGWQTSSTNLSEFLPGQSLQSSQLSSHILITQIVRSARDDFNTLYVAGEPVAVNQPGTAAWRSNDDLFGVHIGSTPGYSVRSLFPVVSEAALRSAGNSYPAWVERHYLSLPSEVPVRVKDLAFQLTAGERVPYDRAKAIQQYLRTIPYTLDVPHPPSDQDLVDYFLYDLRQGYCDYYASAMVVLARLAGVPARMAVGFASGTYQLNSHRFQVTEADAHSWVEVYFPDIGWVAFEPTASRPVPEGLPADTLAVAQDQAIDQNFGDVTRSRWIPGAGLIMSVVLGIAVLSVSIYSILDELRLHRLSETKAAGEVYRRLRGYGARLGVLPQLGDTPYEYAAVLASRLLAWDVSGKRSAFLAKLAVQVNSLVNGIVRTSYNPFPGQGQRKDLSISAQWSKLRWHLRLMWLFRYYNSFQKYLHGIWTDGMH